MGLMFRKASNIAILININELKNIFLFKKKFIKYIIKYIMLFNRVRLDIVEMDGNTATYERLRKLAAGTYNRVGSDDMLAFLGNLRMLGNANTRVHRYPWYYRDNGVISDGIYFVIEYMNRGDLDVVKNGLVGMVNDMFGCGDLFYIGESVDVANICLNRDVYKFNNVVGVVNYNKNCLLL